MTTIDTKPTECPYRGYKRSVTREKALIGQTYPIYDTWDYAVCNLLPQDVNCINDSCDIVDIKTCMNMISKKISDTNNHL